MSQLMKIELLGADIEGYSGKNTVGLKLLGPSGNLKELTEIFSEVLCSPLFLENEIEIVKQDILSYLNRKKQNYAALAADKFYEMLFPNHPYSMNQFGTDESLKNIVRDDISNAYKESIINSNLLVSAVGNFDLDKLIEHLNGNLDKFLDKTDVFDDWEFLIPDDEYPIFVMAVLNNIRKDSIIDTIVDSIMFNPKNNSAKSKCYPDSYNPLDKKL